MAYSYIEYVGDGSTDSFSIPFPYMDSAEVSVFVDGVEDTGATFLSSGLIQTSSAPATNAVVRVARSTNITSRAVDFSSGSVLTEEDLDQSNIQVFYAAQEAIDTAGEAIFKTADGKFDAQNRVIKNVADPVDANDAVNKDWAETGMSSQLAIATTQANNASSSATSASSSAATATTQAGIATTKATEASSSAASALSSKNAASASETAAAASASTATTQANTATTKAGEASTSATSASNSATTATTQANVATSAASTATAQATSATNSANSASASATTATTKAGDASTSATSAAQSAAEAQGYRDTTLGYRDSASTSATSALSSKNAAATSETNAATSAATATTKASEAAASAVSAAQSAASAATVLDNFDDRYLGAKSSDPATDNDGQTLIVGALYFNSTDGVMKIYTASGWLAASSASVATMAKYRFTATAGQTVFTGADDGGDTLSMTVGSEIVTLNGIVLEAGTDYTPASGSVTLATGATADDEVNVYAFGNFQVADTVSKSLGGTFDANVNVLGNVGIGTSSPAGELHVAAPYHPEIRLQSTTGGGTAMLTGGASYGQLTIDADRDNEVAGSYMQFRVDGTESMRIDPNGQVGISHTPSSSVSADTKNLFVGGLTCIRGTTGTSGKQNFNNGIQFNAYPTGSQSDNAIVSSSANDFLPLKYSQNNGVHRFFGSTSATAGSAISWNEYMKIDQAGRVTMPYQPAFSAWAYTFGNTTLTNGSLQTNNSPTWGVLVNRGSNFNTSTSRYTVPVAGVYTFIGQVSHSASATNSGDGWGMTWFKNGVEVMEETVHFTRGAVAGDEGNTHGTVLLDCQAGDYIEIQFQNIAQTLTISNAYFAGYLIG